MDKYEYKVRSEEIKSLIAEGAYAEAAEIADTIDWRRVKSVMMLCTIGDLYKVNRRYEDAKNMLLLAYDKKPGGRTICYSLCELCIKTEEFVQAVNYYNEFTHVAPKDPERYILQYRLYEAQNVNLEERISVLEELKKRDYREKWAYELAYLYHRVGLATRCVEECDELILWFGEGKYVIKAMELKMLHQPLTYEQQEVYDHRFDEYVEETGEQEYTEEGALPVGEDDIADQEAMTVDGESVPEEMDIQVKTMDVGKYNTINLQEELAAGLQEVLGTENVGNYGEDYAYEEPVSDDMSDDMMEETEIFFGETGEIDEAALEAVGKGAFFEEEGQAEAVQTTGPADSENNGTEDAWEEDSVYVETENGEDATSVPAEDGEAVQEQIAGDADVTGTDSEDTSVIVMDQMREEAAEGQAQPPKELEDVLLQETDGQIRMVLPERTAVERQITGQMKIDDILAEWERMKKENEEKCKEEVRQHVLRQTGPMFTEFEAAVRDGLLEKLEGASKERTDAGPGKKTSEAAGETESLTDVNAVGNLVQSGSGAGALEEEAEPACMEISGNQETESPEYGEATEWNDGQDEPYDMEQTEFMGDEVTGEKPEQEEDAEWIEDGNELDYAEEPSDYAEEEAGYGFGYGEAPEWTEEQSREMPVYEEDTEWSGDEIQPDYIEGEYEERENTSADGEWVQDGEEYSENPEYAGEEELCGEVEEEDSEWAQDGAEYRESPVYDGEDAFIGDAEEDSEWADDWDFAAVSAESAEYIEGGEAEVDDLDGLTREEMPEYEDELENPEIADQEEEGQSEALDYLEALEHVEEAESLEEQESKFRRRRSPDTRGYEPAASEEKEEPPEETAQEAEKADASSTDGIVIQTDREEKAAAAENIRNQEKAPTASESHGRLIPEREKAKVRSMTREEKELFAPFIQNRQSREQLVKAIDGISMAAYTGNVVITGEEGMDTLTLAKNIIREVRMTDSNFSGKVAKVTGQGLNRKNVRETLEELHNGALIIQKASGMDSRTAGMLHISLQQEKFGIIVIMEDTKKAIQKLFLGTPQLFGDFTARVDLEALSNDTLVSFGRRYAREKEYSIDDLGMLALHTRIEEGQTIDHVVTVIEVKQIVDEAIRHANRKTIGHFFDILLARRYDDEDMIILTEKDFVA